MHSSRKRKSRDVEKQSRFEMDEEDEADDDRRKRERKSDDMDEDQPVPIPVEDSDDESDEEEVQVKSTKDRIRVAEVTNISECWRAVYGESTESEEFDRRLATYKSENWAMMADSLLNCSLDTTCSDRDLLVAFQLFYHLFCYRYNDINSVVDRVQSIYQNVLTMKEQYEKVKRLFGVMHYELMRRSIIDDTRVGRDIDQMVNLIAYSIKMSFECMVHVRLLQKGTDKSTRSMLHEMSPMSVFTELDTSKLKKHQQLIHFFFRLAFKHNYRKDKGCLYRPRFNSEDEYVYAYEYVCEISDFVFQGLYPIEQNHYWFECLTERGATAKQVVDILTSMKSEWLPDLERNRDIHSFQNGLFMLSTNRFFPYKKNGDQLTADRLQGNVVAIKYHDIIYHEQEMDEEMMSGGHGRDYMKIKLDPIHSLLAHQKFDLEERRWIFCFLGRMFHRLNEHDRWGVFVYFLGLAGTGKSTLLRLLASMLEARDVGYFNNQLQKTFSLDGIHDKLMYLALDIDETFQLDQITWQSMVSGEEVSIVRKYKTPLTKIWESHGGFAGNKLPNWQDNSGSLSRRLIIIEFLVPVSKTDPGLFEKCVNMADRVLKVLNSAYLSLAAQHKDKGVKEVLPPKFKASEQKALVELNALVAFIKECTDLDPDSGHPTYTQDWKEFNACFKNFCHRNSIKHKPLSYNNYNGVFCKYQVSLRQVVDPALDTFGHREPYILGLRLKPSALASAQ